MKRNDMPQFLFAGALSGGITGTFDVFVAVIAAKHGITAAAAGAALAFAVSAFLPLGVLMGVLMFGCASFLPVGGMVRRTTTMIRKPLVSVGVVAAFLLGCVGIVWVGYKQGIMIDAIDYRPLILSLGFGALFFASGWALRPYRRVCAVGVVSSVAVALLLFWALAFGLRGTSRVFSLIGAETSLVKYTFQGVKSGFDRDGDGFATLLCGADCDCDDRQKNRNPGALDIPGNGIDEDCNGADLASEPQARTGGGDAVQLSGTPYNILLITVDTLRADRLHMYGYERETTPNLDKFAKASVLFEQVRSQGPSTRHVFPVLLTGRYFSTVALKKGKKWSKLLPENKTFAEYLKEKDYRTIAVLPYFRFKEHSGFQQGFDVWETITDGDRDATWDPTGDLVTDRGIEHLDTLIKSDSPWLLWLHYFDPHASYVNHIDQQSFGTTRADRYDGEILYVDRQIQRFLDAFEAGGVAGRTAVVFASDHGEGIGLETDHGFNYHGFSLFDSETRIPLIIKVPGVAPRSVSTSVGLIDVPPTILGLAGMAPPEDVHGVSLVPFLVGKQTSRPPFLMQLPEKNPEHAIVDWPFKLIWRVKSNQFSLFNLEADPHEQADLAEAQPETVAALTKLLKLKLFELSREPAGK